MTTSPPYRRMLNNLEWSIPMTHGMHGMVSKFILVCIDCNHAGTKNVAKELKTICAGPVKTRLRDKMWFAELSDKGMCCVVLFFFFSKEYQRTTCTGA